MPQRHLNLLPQRNKRGDFKKRACGKVEQEKAGGERQPGIAATPASPGPCRACPLAARSGCGGAERRRPPRPPPGRAALMAACPEGAGNESPRAGPVAGLPDRLLLAPSEQGRDLFPPNLRRWKFFKRQ